MEYNLNKPWLSLDPWQKKVLESTGNIAIRSARQCGKSAVVSIKAGEHAVKKANQNIIIVAKVERQALLLFEKVLGYVHEKYRYMIAKGRDKPTRHKLTLINGSTILCIPTGESGYGIRGHTVDLLIVDEAAFINQEVYNAITPMLAVTQGTLWLLSTPQGRGGFFYQAFKRKDFQTFHVSYLECPRRDEEFIKFCRETMTKAVFEQEIMGEFVDELHRFFSDMLISRTCVLSRPERLSKTHPYFCGVDVARMGTDESVFSVLEREGNMLRQVENVITTKTLTTQTTENILELDRRYNFRQIYIDDGGLGVAVFDNLLDREQTRRKVTAINNARRSLDRDDKHKKKLMKEDLYNNLLRLMEQRKILLLKDAEIMASLRSIQFEYTEKGLKIYGNYSHIVESLIRSAYCVKDKHLNMFITFV
jgi:hypothetical protein